MANILSVDKQIMADKVYAWSHETDEPDRPRRHVTVLHSHPITSARDGPDS